jgi:general secretion pathway protein J
MSQAGVTLIELLVAMTLLSLLSVGMLFALRVGLTVFGKTNERIIENRRALGVERILTQQIAGLLPAKIDCGTGLQTPASRLSFFGGQPQTMQFVSTYSLQQASRGYPQILEFQVIPGENGRGVRLIVNETVYAGPFSTMRFCGGVAPSPTGVPMPIFRPVPIGETSFVLADKLSRCNFFYQERRPDPQPEIWHQVWPRDHLPSAIRIDLMPLEADPAKIQVPPIVVPIRINRQPMVTYAN